MAVVFIPVAEPWRNGIIEKFNHTYQQRFLKAYTFENLEKLTGQEQTFINFHNQYSGNILSSKPAEVQALVINAFYFSATQV